MPQGREMPDQPTLVASARSPNRFRGTMVTNGDVMDVISFLSELCVRARKEGKTMTARRAVRYVESIDKAMEEGKWR